MEGVIKLGRQVRYFVHELHNYLNQVIAVL